MGISCSHATLAINELESYFAVTLFLAPFLAHVSSRHSKGRMLYLQEVNKTRSYLRQCWGKGFGLLMDMAYHKLLRFDSSIEPNVLNRIDTSTRFVLIQDQSAGRNSSETRLKSNVKLLTIIGRPFSQQVVAELLAPPFAPAPLSDAVPAFCDVCERAPGDKAPG
jgi:hypothetical protein